MVLAELVAVAKLAAVAMRVVLLRSREPPMSSSRAGGSTFESRMRSDSHQPARTILATAATHERSASIDAATCATKSATSSHQLISLFFFIMSLPSDGECPRSVELAKLVKLSGSLGLSGILRPDQA